jgi:uncharacterized RDD family membrane protein YckC
VEGNSRGPDAQFAEWFVWAKREISGDIRACLGAAQAAMGALDEGRGEDAARMAARASTAGMSQTLASQVPARRRAYAEWYDWSRREIRGDPERLHAATRAAMAHLDSGGDAGQASELARSAVGTLPEPPAPVSAAAGAPAPVAASTAEQAPAAMQPPAATMPTQPYQPILPPPVPPAEAAAPVPYAGFWRRLAAFLIDTVLLAAASYAVGFVLVLFAFASVFAAGQSLSDDKLTGITIGAYVIEVVLVWLYYAGLESSPWQATIGKRVMRLAVTDVEGRRISFARATGRYFAKLLSVLTLFIGFVIAAFTRRKQALQDLLAGTLVYQRALMPAVAERRPQPRSTSNSPAGGAGQRA